MLCNKSQACSYGHFFSHMRPLSSGNIFLMYYYDYKGMNQSYYLIGVPQYGYLYIQTHHF